MVKTTIWLTFNSHGQVKAEKPAWHLGVVAGAILKTMDVVASGSAEYLGYLEKGQLPPARLSLTTFQHVLVLEGQFLDLRSSPLYLLAELGRPSSLAIEGRDVTVH